MIYIKHISWGVIFMYAFQLYKHRRKFRYFSDCVADSYEKVFGIILTNMLNTTYYNYKEEGAY